MAYLIPSSIFKTVFGLNLRTYMKPFVAIIKDYTQEKVFDNALVKSSIMVLDMQREEEILHYRDMTLGHKYMGILVFHSSYNVKISELLYLAPYLFLYYVHCKKNLAPFLHNLSL